VPLSYITYNMVYKTETVAEKQQSASDIIHVQCCNTRSDLCHVSSVVTVR